jgi:hypothetical protein
MGAYNERSIIGVTYEKIMPSIEAPYEQTKVILAVRFLGQVSAVESVLPIERSRIPSDWTAAHLVLADLETSLDYKIEMPIPAIWNIPKREYVTRG